MGLVARRKEDLLAHWSTLIGPEATRLRWKQVRLQMGSCAATWLDAQREPLE